MASETLSRWREFVKFTWAHAIGGVILLGFIFSSILIRLGFSNIDSVAVFILTIVLGIGIASAISWIMWIIIKKFYAKVSVEKAIDIKSLIEKEASGDIHLAPVDRFLLNIETRLTNSGFEIGHTSINGVNTLIARKQIFIASLFSKVDVFIIFGIDEHINRDKILEFTKQSLIYSIRNRRGRLPNGIGNSVGAIPVLLSNKIDMDAKLYVVKEPSVQKKPAYRLPVLINTEDHKIYYYKDTPPWGGLYYHNLRKIMHALLLEESDPNSSND